MCFYCGCSVCGLKPEGLGKHLPIVVCVVCRSTTHQQCASSLLENDHGVSIDPNEFFCSEDCLLRISLAQNPQFSLSISEQIEKEFQEKWEAVVKMAGGGSAMCFPECGKEAYLQLRFEGWRSYFERERLQHSHPILSIPPSLQFQSERFLGALARLISPTGQSLRLCALDPATHPIGSVLALPDKKVWKKYSSFHRAGSSNSFVYEARQLLEKSAVVPSRVFHAKTI